MRDKLRQVGIMAAALCAMVGLTATTVDAGGAVTTSLFLSLSGNVSTPGDPCLPNGDIVQISGSAHVVSIVPPTPINPIRLHFNLADVMGTGQSGNGYIGTGAQDFEFQQVPPTPIIPVNFTLQDTVLPVNFTLNFDQSGRLVGGSASLQTGGGT
jgi:hypothetical protein